MLACEDVDGGEAGAALVHEDVVTSYAETEVIGGLGPCLGVVGHGVVEDSVHIKENGFEHDIVYGLLFMVYGLRFKVYGLLFTVYCLRVVAVRYADCADYFLSHTDFTDYTDFFLTTNLTNYTNAESIAKTLSVVAPGAG